jgi:hypothetical protein
MSRAALMRYHAPISGQMRFVAAKTVGNESAWDTHEDFRADEGDPREHILWAGRKASYDAHRADTIAAAVAHIGKPISEWSKDDWKTSGLGDRLRTLRRLAGESRVLVNGGRERMAPVLGPVGRRKAIRVADGKPEPVEVHRNELPAATSSFTTMRDATPGLRGEALRDDMRERLDGATVRREAKDAMRQESIDAQRVAPDDDSYHAGTGLPKGHTHEHLGFRDGAYEAWRDGIEREVQEHAVAQLIQMRGELPFWPNWFRARVTDGWTWVERNRLDDLTLVGEREDPTPYIDERGSSDGVWVSAADEAAYESIVW